MLAESSHIRLGERMKLDRRLNARALSALPQHVQSGAGRQLLAAIAENQQQAWDVRRIEPAGHDADAVEVAPLQVVDPEQHRPLLTEPPEQLTQRLLCLRA